MILGEKPAPWEDEKTAAPLAKRFGHLKGAVLALLERSPSARPSMAALQHACHGVLSNTSTTPLNASECDLRGDGEGGLGGRPSVGGAGGGGSTSLTWERNTDVPQQQPSTSYLTATEQNVPTD